jgi:hypothetical protein
MAVRKTTTASGEKPDRMADFPSTGAIPEKRAEANAAWIPILPRRPHERGPLILIPPRTGNPSLISAKRGVRRGLFRPGTIVPSGDTSRLDGASGVLPRCMVVYRIKARISSINSSLIKSPFCMSDWIWPLSRFFSAGVSSLAVTTTTGIIAVSGRD